ncbi:MAG: hypothetical protein OK452_06935 [Thaumarchaeota archaeon]|nr:hypothetical protein [Nitrososphaerota archaeon]
MRVSAGVNLPKAGLAIGISLLFLSMLPTSRASAQISSGVRAQIGQAYSAVLTAEQDGGNISSLVATLNTAISLVQQADSINDTNPSKAQALYAKAASLASQVVQASPSVAAAGRASVGAAQLALVAETVALIGIAVVTYRFGPRLFWTVWLRAHRTWKVRKS